MDFKDILQNRLDTKTRFTQADYNAIQKGILETNEAIQNEYIDIESRHASALFDALNAERILMEENVGDISDMSLLPAYVSQMLGGDLRKPDEIRFSADAQYERAKADIDEQSKNFYDDVFELRRFHLDKPNYDVFGVSDLSRNQPVIVGNDTVAELGENYEAFEKEKFQEILHRVKPVTKSETSEIANDQPSAEEIVEQRIRDNKKNPYVYPKPGYMNTYGRDGYSFEEKDDNSDLANVRGAQADAVLGNIDIDYFESEGMGK